MEVGDVTQCGGVVVPSTPNAACMMIQSGLGSTQRVGSWNRSEIREGGAAAMVEAVLGSCGNFLVN